MIRKEDVYKIGKLGKAHGVKGEISFMFDDDIFNRADADYLILEVDGILVPFFLEEYRFRSDSTALVKFCDIDTLERARELTNCDVFMPRDMNDNQEEITWTFLVGFAVIDNDTQQVVGHIASIDDSTINILFCLEDGQLIPASEELITAIDQNKKTITMALPQGILEI